MALFIFTDNPTILLAKNWPIVLIAFVSATVANATAVGGGFIFLPLFSFAYSLSPVASLKLALSTQAFGMSSGALGWSKSLIDFRYFKYGAITGILGMLIGTFIIKPDPNLIHGIFGYASILVGIGIFIEILYLSKSKKNKTQELTNSSVIEYSAFAFIGGLITAWTSIGIGEVVALWMLFRAKENMVKCVATGVAVLAICSISGLVFHTIEGGIAWDYLWFTAPGVILGGRAGAVFGKKLVGQKSSESNKQEEGHHKEVRLKIFVAVIILIDGLVVILNS